MIQIIIDSIILYLISQSVSAGEISFSLRKKGYLFYNILCVVLCLYFISIFIPNYRIAFLITAILIFVLSLTMYYLHEFRGTNVNFSDILSINTAKEVAGGYTYNIKPIFVFALIFIFFMFKIHFDFIGAYRYILAFPHSRFTRIVLCIVVFLLLRKKISESKYDYSLFAGKNEGYLYNFFSSISIFHKNVCDDAEIEKAKDNFIATSYKINEERVNTIDTNTSQDFNNIYRPHIIVVMNESFGSAHRRVKTNVEVTPYFDSLKGLTKGNLYVNTFGGGTANTEFEFLTGMSIGNYEYPVMPYNNFVKRDKYSLARYFDNLGYKTVAMHPYTATNYHRDKVYKRFGFDELIFFDEFKNKEEVRNFVSDESFYKEVIDRFEKAVRSDEKLFLFGITMQNHSGYKHFDGAEVKSDITIDGDKEALDSYLSLMKISDTALKTLIEYFEKAKEHVIILFFGDHNASFGTKINSIVYDDSIVYETTNAYETPFFIFDNKHRADGYIEGVSANFLSLELLEKAHLPKDNLHILLDNIYRENYIYNYHKMKSRKEKVLRDIPEDVYFSLERAYLK